MAALAVSLAAGLRQGYFKTPSGNIMCNYVIGAAGFVDCGIRSGLKPAVRPHRCAVGDPIHRGGHGFFISRAR